MSPFTDPVLELRLVAERAEFPVFDAATPHARLEDHRTDVLGELLDAIDRIDPGLGTRLLHAMYPRARLPWALPGHPLPPAKVQAHADTNGLAPRGL